MSVAPGQTRVANIYNPQTQSKAELIEGFVARQKTFQRLYKTIKEAKMEVPEQHYLLLGRRGMGKTTLLLRLAYEVEGDPALNTWLIPLVFNEEEYGIRRLFNFWERILELLAQQLPDSGYNELLRRQLSAQHKDDDSYERALFDLLINVLRKAGKKIILFVHNFDDMARKLTDAEAHRLRKILQSAVEIRIFAASAVVLEAFYRYDHPFYEFFKTVELQGLDAKETRELLLSLATHYKKAEVERIVTQYPGRVEALRRITGGVIRTMVLLFEIFADDGEGSAFEDLEVILDRVTPLYKHHMDDLSDQQQSIVEAIALNWDGINVKEIVECTRLDSKTISAQLQNLEKNGVVEKRASWNKNNIYLIAERFFNIWYLMRHGRRNDEKRVLWLVHFFEEWCDDEMIKSRVASHLLAIQRGGVNPGAALMITQAFAQCSKLGLVEKHDLLQETQSFLSQEAPEMADALPESELDRAYAAVQEWFEGDKLLAKKKLDPLAQVFFSADVYKQFENASNSKLKHDFWERQIMRFVILLGNQYLKSKNPDVEKMVQCRVWRALNNPQEPTKTSIQAIDEIRSEAFFNFGAYFQRIEYHIGVAMKSYEQAASLGNLDAMNNIGYLYHTNFKNNDKALEWYKKAAELGHDLAVFNLGVLFKTEYAKFDEAIDCFEKAANKGLPNAMFQLGLSLQQYRNDVNAAKKWYEKAADMGSLEAMNNLGRLYQVEYNDWEKALEWYSKAFNGGLVQAAHNLGLVYQYHVKDIEQAVKYYEQGANAGDADSMLNLGFLYQSHYKDNDQAMYWYHKGADEGHVLCMNSIAWLLFETRKDKEEALYWLEKALASGGSINVFVKHTAACIYAWNNQLQDSKVYISDFLKDEKLLDLTFEDIITCLTLLIAKNESKWLLQQFTAPEGEALQLKDRFKPIYYAVLKQLDHPDFLRMGDELQQTVEEVLAKARQMAVDYA